MQPTNEQIKKQLQDQYAGLMVEQQHAENIKNAYVQDKEITRILNAKNKITIQLMNLK